MIIALTAIGALVVAGCSSSTTSSAGANSVTAAATSCIAPIGIEETLTGPAALVGQEQLHFAELALASDNLANKTNISLVHGDTPSLVPAQYLSACHGTTSTVS